MVYMRLHRRGHAPELLYSTGPDSDQANLARGLISAFGAYPDLGYRHLSLGLSPTSDSRKKKQRKQRKEMSHEHEETQSIDQDKALLVID